MWLFIFLVVSFIVIFKATLSYGDKLLKDDEDAKLKTESALKRVNFKSDKYDIPNADNLMALAISETQNQLAVLHRETLKDNFSVNIIDFKNIIEVGLMKDDKMITKTSKGMPIVGGLVGGIGGAIVGGLLSDKSTESNISELSLEIVVDDILKPRITIPFLIRQRASYNKNEEIVKKYIEMSEDWFRTMTVIMNRNENKKKLF